MYCEAQRLLPVSHRVRNPSVRVSTALRWWSALAISGTVSRSVAVGHGTTCWAWLRGTRASMASRRPQVAADKRRGFGLFRGQLDSWLHLVIHTPFLSCCNFVIV